MLTDPPWNRHGSKERAWRGRDAKESSSLAQWFENAQVGPADDHDAKSLSARPSWTAVMCGDA